MNKVKFPALLFIAALFTVLWTSMSTTPSIGDGGIDVEQIEADLPNAYSNNDQFGGLGGIYLKSSSTTAATVSWIGRKNPVRYLTVSNKATDSFVVSYSPRDYYVMFPPGQFSAPSKSNAFWHNVSNFGNRVDSGASEDTVSFSVKFSSSTGDEEIYVPIPWYNAGRPVM